MGAAPGAREHLGQTHLQGLRVGLGQGQFGLADQSGQRRAQLVGRIIEKALFLSKAAAHGRQQLVDRASQEPNEEYYFVTAVETGLALETGLEVKQKGSQVVGRVLLSLLPPEVEAMDAEWE